MLHTPFFQSASSLDLSNVLGICDSKISEEDSASTKAINSYSSNSTRLQVDMTRCRSISKHQCRYTDDASLDVGMLGMHEVDHWVLWRGSLIHTLHDVITK